MNYFLCSDSPVPRKNVGTTLIARIQKDELDFLQLLTVSIARPVFETCFDLDLPFVTDVGFRPRWPDEVKEGDKGDTQFRKWYVTNHD